MTTDQTSELIGFARVRGEALVLSVSVDAFKKCETYEAVDGTEYVKLAMDLRKIRLLIVGEKEVTAIQSGCGE